MTTLVLVVLIALLLLLAGYFVVIYNGLVYLKHNTKKSWSNIDVLLVQRHDELPKLVEVCKQHMQFEAQALERIMAARSGANIAREKGDVAAVGKTESVIRSALGNITATIEAYPTLKADQTIQNLMARITGIENAIADRREFYNEAVNLHNVRIEVFPDVIVAALTGFKAADLLEFGEEQKQDVDVKALFRAA